ncbi:MAG: hypothetical protein JRH06_17625 [Deltaproteobacteria bacterium]|nr:hypothetical protein [Deltaproteobacteria bacterium]
MHKKLCSVHCFLCIPLLGEIFRGHGVLLGVGNCEWQEREYILSYFGRTVLEGRRSYYSYMKEGLDQGRRPESSGDDPNGSLGLCSDFWKTPPLSGDGRILGDPDFVSDVLSEAHERLDRRHELQRMGYTLERLRERVLDLYGIEKEELLSRSRQKIRSEARSVFCYWAVLELGISGTEMARRLGMSQSGVAYAIRRGERVAKNKGFKMLE